MPTINLSLIPVFGFETSSHNSGKFIRENILCNPVIEKRLGIQEIKKRIQITDLKQELSTINNEMENMKWDLKNYNYAKKNNRLKEFFFEEDEVEAILEKDRNLTSKK